MAKIGFSLSEVLLSAESSFEIGEWTVRRKAGRLFCKCQVRQLPTISPTQCIRAASGLLQDHIISGHSHDIRSVLTPWATSPFTSPPKWFGSWRIKTSTKCRNLMSSLHKLPCSSYFLHFHYVEVTFALYYKTDTQDSRGPE